MPSNHLLAFTQESLQPLILHTKTVLQVHKVHDGKAIEEHLPPAATNAQTSVILNGVNQS